MVEVLLPGNLGIGRFPRRCAIAAQRPGSYVESPGGHFSHGVNGVFSFFLTATPLMVTYSGRPFL
jgi:hypothetical protein